MPEDSASQQHTTAGSRLAGLDAWMAEHPWHPRIAPFLVYVLFLALIGWIRPHAPNSYPLLYVVQCAGVLWMLWRYRALMPELTLRFHWLALVVGAGVAGAWIGVGLWMVGRFPRFAAEEPHYFELMHPAVRQTSLALRLLGMSIVVPLLEEPFVRSLVLRSMHRCKPTVIAGVQLLSDLPLIGEVVGRTVWSRRADRHRRVLGNEFERTPLGDLSLFGVMMSTIIFMLYHGLRDWPAALLCGVAYCLLLRATRHRGLGPVIWAHGITNALLFLYSATTSDWQFL